MTLIKKLAHLCFFTDNAPQLVSFYCDILEMPVKFELKHADGTSFGWYLDAGDTTFIEIFDQSGAVKEWGGETVRLRMCQESHYRHLCFEVDDIEVTRARLLEKEIAVTEIVVGMDHSKQCWINDPLGNPIELMQYTARSMQLTGRS